MQWGEVELTSRCDFLQIVFSGWVYWRWKGGWIPLEERTEIHRSLEEKTLQGRIRNWGKWTLSSSRDEEDHLHHRFSFFFPCIRLFIYLSSFLTSWAEKEVVHPFLSCSSLCYDFTSDLCAQIRFYFFFVEMNFNSIKTFVSSSFIKANFFSIYMKRQWPNINLGIESGSFTKL